MSGKTVVVGMSGGVDSSVAALLLKQQGYNVIGLFMHNWEETEPNGACTAEEDFADVRRVCDTLGIPYYSVNFADQYMERVFSHFLEEYAAGRTPNPDVLCNREIKFGPFREYAKKLGADCIATGHYCGISHTGGRNYLLKCRDTAKDQTYFLNQVREEQLDDVIFPLQDLVKSEVRDLAEQYGLSTAKKKDSTGICFIGERKFKTFLQTYLPAQPGKIVTLDGEIVGEHSGLMYYTLGQRRGLNIGGKHGEEGRWFVVSKDLKDNILYVSHGDEGPLYSRACLVTGLNWIGEAPDIPASADTSPAAKRYGAKFRYRQPDQSVTISAAGGLDIAPGPDGVSDETSDGVLVTYDTPQRAVTEGQYAVFYDGSRCLGGGVITEVYK